MKEECKSPGIKRIIDFVVAVVCLILFSPLILVCWLLIKTDGQPAIYRQERIGLGGKPHLQTGAHRTGRKAFLYL